VIPGYQTETAADSAKRTRRFHWQLWAAMLAIAVALTTVPTAWTHPAGVARAQDEIATGDTTAQGQVIAQGITRLQRGEVAWTVRSIEIPGGEGTLNLLADGEAAFLPVGKAGVLASRQHEGASL
jgi:hypothetical protein